MAELFRSTPFQLGIFQQDPSYRPSSTPSTEGSSSSHSVELAHRYPAHHAGANSGYDSSFYDPAMKAENMERQSSATSGDSENPTPSSSGLDYAPPSAAERLGNQEIGRAKSRRRTTPDQLLVLEKQFESNPKPDIDLRKKLSEQLQMTPREVQVWFQNRRAKAKKLAKRAEEEQDGAHEEYPEHEAVPVPSFASGSAATFNWSSQLRAPSQLSANLGAQRGALPTGPSLYSEGWPSSSYVLQPSYAPDAWSIPPATTSSLDPLLADVLASVAPDVSPLAATTPLPAGPSSLQLPLLPRADPFVSESGPSSSSTVFTNFAFGDAAARRGSTASVDSFLTEASETGTVSGTLTPVSTAGSIAGFDGLLPPGFDATRRSSCPPELIAHFQEANLAQTNPVWALEQLVSSPPSVAPARQSSFSSNPATHQAHFALMNNLGRRHSVAVDAPYASSSSLSPRRSSLAATLDPIAEHDQMLASPNGITGALRRASAARKSRSQASMRQHLVRPVPTLPDGQVPITSTPQFDL